jgi:hypothetical protein
MGKLFREQSRLCRFRAKEPYGAVLSHRQVKKSYLLLSPELIKLLQQYIPIPMPPYRMLFWNFFFPIFRDYPFRFDPNKERCSSWDHLQQSWILWALICLTLGLSLALVLLLGQKLRSRANSRANGNHHPPILTNSTTTTPTNNPRL